MLEKTSALLVCALFAAVSIQRSEAATMAASGTAAFNRGDPTVGLIPGFYGAPTANVPPLLLPQSLARDFVIGLPDGRYLSLPGRNDTPPGTGFTYAYVEITFPSTFIAQGTVLDVFESGAAGENEQALLWLWVSTGGFIHQNLNVRNAPWGFHVDLTSLQPVLDIFGPGAAFTRIGIGGLDILGPSPGFDLDAILVTTAVPEPATAAQIAFALMVGALVRRRRG